MSQSNSKVEQSLMVMKENGLKYTKKREAIITYLIRRNRYITAKEVYEFMNKEYKGVSYDTIYRNLHDFEMMNLLEATDLNGEKNSVSIVVKKLVIIIILFVQFAEKRKRSICVQWTSSKSN